MDNAVGIGGNFFMTALESRLDGICVWGGFGFTLRVGVIQMTLCASIYVHELLYALIQNFG